MKEELMTEVMQQMLPYLDNAQLKQLRQVMEQTLYHYEVTGAEARPEEDDSNDLIAMFIAAKRIEGCSEKTLKYYQTTSRKECPSHPYGGFADIPYRLPEQESVKPGNH